MSRDRSKRIDTGRKKSNGAPIYEWGREGDNKASQVSNAIINDPRGDYRTSSSEDYEIVDSNGDLSLTSETRTLDDGTVVNRIVYSNDSPGSWYKAGDVGGFVESLDNVGGQAYISENSMVTGNAYVCDNAAIYDCHISGDAFIGGNPSISNSTISGNAKIIGTPRINNTTIGDNASVRGQAVITNSTISGAPVIGQNASVRSSTVSGNAKVGGFSIVKNSGVSGESHIVGKPVLYKCEISGATVISNSVKIKEEKLHDVKYDK